jgi:hypothetical protein
VVVISYVHRTGVDGLLPEPGPASGGEPTFGWPLALFADAPGSVSQRLCPDPGWLVHELTNSWGPAISVRNEATLSEFSTDWSLATTDLLSDAVPWRTLNMEPFTGSGATGCVKVNRPHRDRDIWPRLESSLSTRRGNCRSG